MPEQRRLDFERPKFTAVVRAIPFLVTRTGKDLGAHPKWVLAVLAQVCNWDTWQTERFRDDISALTSLSDSTVSRAILVLRTEGFITRYRNLEGGPWRTRLEVRHIVEVGEREQSKRRNSRRRFAEKPFEGCLSKEAPDVTQTPTQMSHRHVPSSERPEGVSERADVSPEREEVGATQTPHLYPSKIRSSPSPSGRASAQEGKGNLSGEPERRVPDAIATVADVVAAWNSNPKLPPTNRITARIQLPDFMSHIGKDVALRTVEVFIEGQIAKDSKTWMPGSATWSRFRTHGNQAAEWVIRPDMPEPGMGRRLKDRGGTRRGKTFDAGRASRHRFTDTAPPPAGPEEDIDDWDSLFAPGGSVGGESDEE